MVSTMRTAKHLFDFAVFVMGFVFCCYIVATPVVYMVGWIWGQSRELGLFYLLSPVTGLWLVLSLLTARGFGRAMNWW